MSLSVYLYWPQLHKFLPLERSLYFFDGSSYLFPPFLHPLWRMKRSFYSHSVRAIWLRKIYVIWLLLNPKRLIFSLITFSTFASTYTFFLAILSLFSLSYLSDWVCICTRSFDSWKKTLCFFTSDDDAPCAGLSLWTFTFFSRCGHMVVFFSASFAILNKNERDVR